MMRIPDGVIAFLVILVRSAIDAVRNISEIPKSDAKLAAVLCQEDRKRNVMTRTVSAISRRGNVLVSPTSMDCRAMNAPTDFGVLTKDVTLADAINGDRFLRTVARSRYIYHSYLGFDQTL